MKPQAPSHRNRTSHRAAVITLGAVTTVMTFVVAHPVQKARRSTHADPICYIVNGQTICVQAPSSDTAAVRWVRSSKRY